MTTTGPPERHPPKPGRRRFPLRSVVIRGAALVVATYLWSAWGRCWEVVPGDIVEGNPPAGLDSWEGRRVRIRGAPGRLRRDICGADLTPGRNASFRPVNGLTRDWLGLVTAAAGSVPVVEGVWVFDRDGPSTRSSRSSPDSTGATDVFSFGPYDGADVRGRVTLTRECESGGVFALVDATRTGMGGWGLLAICLAFWAALSLTIHVSRWRKGPAGHGEAGDGRASGRGEGESREE